MPIEQKIYRLEGKSLEAARAVYAAMHSPTQILGGEDFYHEYAHEMKTLGWNSRAVQVFKRDGSLPRAYEYGPRYYIGTSKNPAMSMKVQVDYQGRHFAPEDAVLLDAKGIVESGIYSDRPKEFLVRDQIGNGRAMPADFNASLHTCLRISPDFNKAGDLFLKGVERLEQYFYDGILTFATREEEVYFHTGLTCDKNRRPLLTMAAYRTGNNEAVPLRSNGWLRVEKDSHNFYIVRPDIKTAGGRALQDALDNIPDLPDYATLWREHDQIDAKAGFKLPPLPLELIHQDLTAAWPFPVSAPAP